MATQETTFTDTGRERVRRRPRGLDQSQTPAASSSSPVDWFDSPGSSPGARSTRGSGIKFDFLGIMNFTGVMSPFIISTFLLLLSLYNLDAKALVFLGGALIFSFIGALLKPLIGNATTTSSNCSVFRIPFANQQFDSPSLNSLFIAFTLMYLFMPMISNSTVNYGMLVTLLILFFINAWYSITNKCTTGLGAFLGGVLGLGFGLAWWAIFHYAGYRDLLYFEPVTSNNVICNRPSRQTFKCSVYKNGQLLKNL